MMTYHQDPINDNVCRYGLLRCFPYFLSPTMPFCVVSCGVFSLEDTEKAGKIARALLLELRAKASSVSKMMLRAL